jgi:SM-20-related protein
LNVIGRARLNLKRLTEKACSRSLKGSNLDRFNHCEYMRLRKVLSHDPGDEQDLFKRLATDLEARGFSIQPASLPDTVSGALARHLDEISGSKFQKAATGRGTHVGPNRFVRRDRIYWLNELDPSVEAWFSWSHRLQDYLNQNLFLGLFSFECHFARYEKGDFYKRHLDAFRGERNRIVSLVTYLNEGWLPDQGGQLLLYPEDHETIKVTPELGTVVLFLSEEIPHEVLPAHRNRLGVAGWFRVNTSAAIEKVDPSR